MSRNYSPMDIIEPSEWSHLLAYGRLAFFHCDEKTILDVLNAATHSEKYTIVRKWRCFGEPIQIEDRQLELWIRGHRSLSMREALHLINLLKPHGENAPYKFFTDLNWMPTKKTN